MDILMAVLGYAGVVVFVAALLVGALLTLLGLPGTVVILLAAVIYSAATGWSLVWWLLLILLGLSLFAELSDNIVGALGVKKYGGSTSGMLWSLLGGLAGAIAFGLAMSALPVVGAIIGPILGGLIGGFAGSYWYERRQGRSTEEARKAGFGAMVGRAAGTMLKTALAGVMVIVVLLNAFG